MQCGPVPVSMAEIHLLHLLLTGACNLHCDYCYQDRSPRRMGFDTLRRALDWACRVTRPDLKIVFSGGEPLLEMPMIRRAVEYVEGRRDPAKPIRYTLLTNGLLLDEEKARYLVDHGFDLQISLDGVAGAQDLRASGSFESLDRLLLRLNDEHSAYCRRHLTVALTVVPEAVRHLADSVEYLLRRKVPEVALSPGLGTRAGWVPGRIGELEEQFDRIVDLSVAHYRASGEVPLLSLRGERSCASPSEVREAVCGVPQAKTPAIDMDGMVYGCALLVEPMLGGDSTWFREELERLRMGSLHDPEFETQYEAWGRKAGCSSLLGRRREKRSSYRSCSECAYSQDCSLCPVAIGLSPGNPDPHRIPDYHCAFMQVSLRSRSRFREESGAGVDRLARFLGLSELPPSMARLRSVAMAVAAETAGEKGPIVRSAARGLHSTLRNRE